MHNKLPEPLREVVEQLGKLPGMGPKSALRAALELLKWPRPRAEALGQSILNLREKLFFCEQCAAVSDCNPCCICSDSGRSDHELMLVSEWDSLLAIEGGGFYRGKYMVLGGLLEPLADITPGSLEISRLQKRLEQGHVTELILALGTTLEAESTAVYIKNLARRDFPHVKISRLAQGIPLGAEVKFVDHETLRQSLQHRQDI